MYARNIKLEDKSSAFIFGPRGTGKTCWLRSKYPDAVYIDLLEAELFNSLTADPQRLSNYVPPNNKYLIIVDEIQRVPGLLNEIHRLIEQKKYQFILTGSSARKLRRSGSNLLGGRALTYKFHPFSANELGRDFNFKKALKVGMLPTLYDRDKVVECNSYLKSYVQTYLKEEVQQEGLTRNLSSFARFLEAASFSQGEALSISGVARECSVHRKVVESYFEILDDLLIGLRVPVFTKKAKRRLTSHPKFYFFDVGVFRAIRPKGYLDSPEEIDGAALATLVFQECRAVNDNFQMEYDIFYWRTSNGTEVDFILYGEKGLWGIEVKRKSKLNNKDFSGLKSFQRDYPDAELLLLYGGEKTMYFDDITVYPIEYALTNLFSILDSPQNTKRIQLKSYH